MAVIQSILEIPMDDGLTWDTPVGAPLNHPEMDYPGVRIKCRFWLGKARGLVRMDLAIGDIVEAQKIPLERIRYRGQPLIAPDFDVLTYPPETIFSEKLHIAIQRAGTNTRMKDYYDRFKLSHLKSLDPIRLRRSIEETFAQRETTATTRIAFDEETFDRLQAYWSAFLRKMKITDAPEWLKDVVQGINQKLETINRHE